MAARVLQPSEYEIQREVEALKDLRRRSTTPGALTLDPDLPNQSPPTSPTTHRSGKPPTSPISTIESVSLSSSTESGSSLNRSDSSGSSRGADVPTNPADDPLHLFWVPASLHPEIAPAEFRAFLKEHARSPNPSDGSDSSSMLSPSLSSGSLNRKKSMLSRQYRPKENDGVEQENIVPLKRNRSLMHPTNPGRQFTMNELQKLEELAEAASSSDDPAKFKNLLRRSLSLNLSPSADEMLEEISSIGDEADIPIIVPPPGQILRRTARTKIRKPSLPGDGGGHRFGASRRGAGAATTTLANATGPGEPRTSSEISSSDHGETESSEAPPRRLTLSDEGSQNMTRPDSFSEEHAIYDAYVRDDEDDMSYTPVLSTPVQEPLPLEEHTPTPPPLSDVIPIPQQPPVLHQPQPQHLSVPPPQDQGQPSRTPSPQEPATATAYRPALPSAQFPSHQHPSASTTVPAPAPGRKEKGGKGLFKWGGDKGGKKSSKDKERERAEKEKEKESGFFGSLFSSGKKKQDSEYQSNMTGGTSGREAAQALLGASKSKANAPPTSPGVPPGGNPYARYPIHVERAIYRLSHIKLANPRRPLYEQVLISNLMFWYLGVINKAQNPTPAPQTQQPVAEQANGSANGAANGAGGGDGGAANEQRENAEQEQREKEMREKELREKEAREKAEKEQKEREQREREAMEMKKKESGRRGSLTKTPAGGPPGGGRRAEMPIKGPQYEMQHRVMEQEYGGYNNGNGGQPRSPTTSSGPMQNGHAPPHQHPHPHQRPPQPGPYNNGAPLPPQQQQKVGQAPQQRGQPTDQYYYQSQMENLIQPRPGLPPGAMPPVEQPVWNGRQQQQQPAQPQPQPGQQQPQQRRHPSPNPGSNRRSQSPPKHHPYPQKQPSLNKLNTSQESLGLGESPRSAGSGGRPPGRSLSATAYTAPPLPQLNGASLRKGNSAHAAAPYDKRTARASEGRRSEEEDVPLAVWQQQRRK